MTIESFGKLNEARLQRFESDSGIKLPTDYRSFLLQTNGGVGRDLRVWLAELERWVVVDCLFGLELDPALDLRAWAEELEGELPPGALAIGGDPWGALFILVCPSNEDSEEQGLEAGIYLYDHAHQIPGSGDERNAWRLAGSWTELDEMMSSPERAVQGNARATEAARDHAAEAEAFAQKPAEGSFWVPGGIDRAKAGGKVTLQVVDRLKQARFTHQGAFAAG